MELCNFIKKWHQRIEILESSFIIFFTKKISSTANLQIRTLPRQHIGVNRNLSVGSDGGLVSVIQPQFLGGSIMGHHTLRRPTQSGIETVTVPASSASFYTRNPAIAINTSQHQQFYYGWQTFSPLSHQSPLPSPLSQMSTTSAITPAPMPPSILKNSSHHQAIKEQQQLLIKKPEKLDEKDEIEKEDSKPTWTDDINQMNF